MLLHIWDAQEGRYVVITDTPGAFLQADQEDLVIMKVEGSMAEALLKNIGTIYKICSYEKQKEDSLCQT